jgi:Tfp pilus assembly protein PilF
MLKRHLNLVILLIGSITSACAMSSKVQESGFSSYRDSALSAQNPAPTQMSPPQSENGEAVLIDPVYMRSQADYHFTLGETFSLDGNSEKAIEEFKLTLVYDANAAAVRLRLSAEFVKLGLISEALEQAEYAVKADPQAIEAHLFLASIYTSLKMYDMALNQYQEVLKNQPDHNEASIFVGALLAEQKKFVEAVHYFDRLAKKPKNDSAHLAYYYLGRVYMEWGQPNASKQAEIAFQKSLGAKADFDDGVLALAEIYIESKREDEAVRLMSSYQERFGPEIRVAQRLSQIYLGRGDYEKALFQLEIVEQSEESDLNTKMKISMVLIQQKKFPEAIAKLEQILSVMPDSDKVRFYLAAVFEETNEADTAIKHYLEIPFASSYYGESMIHAAYLYKQNQKIDKAIGVVRTAIDKRPDVAQFYALYASFLDEKKDYSTAVSMLSKATEKFPSNNQIRFFYGTMLDRTGKQEECIDQMKQILAIEEDHAQALNYLAYSYAELGRELVQAEEWARKAITLQPNDAYILDTMGWILYKRGELETSIRYLEQAFQIKSNESIIAEHLGDAYNRFQLPEKAKIMYLRAVEAETDDKKARQIREKIVSIERQKKPFSPAAVERLPASNRTSGH